MTSPSVVFTVVVVRPFVVSTIVSNAVPRTAAVDVGVLTSNVELLPSFWTEAQVRPRVCSMVARIPPRQTRHLDLRARTQR